jgi:hypothetical protein
MDPFEVIGFSAGSSCCICGTEVGGHDANHPLMDKPSFVSKEGKIYCGECAAKHGVNIFHNIKKLKAFGPKIQEEKTYAHAKHGP